MTDDNVKVMIEKSFNGQYEYLGFLGKGAYASVYLVKHRYLDEKRAIKIIDKSLKDDENIRKVFEEVRLAKHLHHENIINIYDAGIITDKTENYAYFILEYVNGGNLEKYRNTYIKADKKMAISRVLSIIHQITQGLNALHSSRPPIIHRDLKTGNILLSTNKHGQPLIKISDFGFAGIITRFAGKKDVGGTMTYMAPECFHGEFTTQSDIYAVGVIFYLLLTNHFPYDVDKYELDDLINSNVWANNLTAPSIYNEAVPDFIDEVVVKCLSVNRILRYTDANELLDDVNRIMDEYDSLGITEEDNPDTAEYLQGINAEDPYYVNSDETNPDDEDEKLLKNTYCLEKYHETVDKYETLTNDAYEYWESKKAKSISNSQKILLDKEELSNKNSKRKEFLSLLLMLTPLYPLNLIYIGISSKMNKLTLEGIITLIPELFYIFYYLSGSSIYYIKQMNILLNYIILLWIISLAYYLTIRKDYLLRKGVYDVVSDDEVLFDTLMEEYS